MWGLTSRGARLTGSRRLGRVYDTGLLRITVRGPVEHAVVDIEGELDFTSASGAIRAVSVLPHQCRELNISALDFVDIAGVRALRTIVREVADRCGEEPAIVGMNPAVQRVFDVVEEKVPTPVDA